MSDFELVELEPMPGRRVAIEGELTIGRHECDLTISSAQVSRRHASISVAGGGAEVTDHGSRNGTFVNDGRVAGSQQLKAGDKVRIGETVWELIAVDVGAPTELESRGDVPAPALEATRVPAAAAAPNLAPDLEATRVPAAAPAADLEATRVPVAAPPAPPASPAPVAAEPIEGLSGTRPPRASAARRVEATLICYAVVVLTAVAVVLYLATR